MGYGFMGHVGLAKEATWGSGVAATDFVEALTENVTMTMDRFDYKSIIGAVAEPDDVVGLRKVAGTIRLAAHPVAMGHFLKGALGTKSLTTVLSGFLWTNDFFSTQSDFSVDTPLQPYTLEVDMDTTTAFRYTGCVVNNLTLAFEPNAAVMMEASIIGRGTSVTSISVPTFPGSPSKPFTFDTVSLSIGGAGTALIESLTVEIMNNLEGIGALNLSTDIAKIRRKDHQMVNISGKLDFANPTEYFNFVNQTEQALAISATKANSFQLVVNIPRMVYTAFPLNNPGKDRILVDFNGKGYYHTGSGTAIRVSLTTVNCAY